MLTANPQVRSGADVSTIIGTRMTYQNPRHVDSPRRHWRLIDVLYNGGDNEASLVLGSWNGQPVLAARWNGTDEDGGIGNPQSRGLPTWFIIPAWLNDAVLKSAVVPKSKVRLATALLTSRADET